MSRTVRPPRTMVAARQGRRAAAPGPRRGCAGHCAEATGRPAANAAGAEGARALQEAAPKLPAHLAPISRAQVRRARGRRQLVGRCGGRGGRGARGRVRAVAVSVAVRLVVGCVRVRRCAAGRGGVSGAPIVDGGGMRRGGPGLGCWAAVGAYPALASRRRQRRWWSRPSPCGGGLRAAPVGGGLAAAL